MNTKILVCLYLFARQSNSQQVINYLPLCRTTERCGIHNASIFNKSGYLSLIPVISSSYNQTPLLNTLISTAFCFKNLDFVTVHRKLSDRALILHNSTNKCTPPKHNKAIIFGRKHSNQSRRNSLEEKTVLK